MELKKGLPLRASLDNIDMKVDTVDGKNSFHGTAITVYQRLMSNPDANMYLTQKVHLTSSQESTEFVRNVPQTVVPLQPCDIKGRPKPANRPHYEHYKIGQHREELQKSMRMDETWLLSRYMGRLPPGLETCDVPTEQKQPIPVWKAFNSLLSQQSPIELTDTPHTLPIVNAPAHEWETLVTVLEQVYCLSRLLYPDDPDRVMVTMDMDLYKRALKLENISTEFANKWFLLPGPFHISTCALRCLGKTVEGLRMLG